jgi:histone deacetylase 1/2
MASAGKPLDNDGMVSYIHSSLNDEAYNGFVAAIIALIKAEKSISLSDPFSQLLSYEAHPEDQNPIGYSSVNSATRGGRGGYRGGRGGGHGYSDQRGYDQQQCGYEFRGYEQRNYDQRNEQHGYNPHGNGGGNGGLSQGYRQQYGGDARDGTRPVCQVCGKEGHIALSCWIRFQKSYRGPEKIVSAAIGSYGVDTNGYSDSRATHHITRELTSIM